MNLDNIHKGKYTPQNPDKYIGDINNITYRSSWEKFVMKWADNNPDVVKWGSEVSKIKYRCGTDGQIHTYYVDFTFKFKSGKIYLIEVKPKKQTEKPKRSSGKSKQTLLTEELTWIKNTSKWVTASKYAKDNGLIFEVWTEDKLKKLGFNLI